MTLGCSFGFQRASFHDRPPPVSSPWQPKGKVTLSHCCSCELTNWWIESKHPAGLQVLFQPCSIGLQVHLQTRLITASTCISEFTRSWPPSASPNSLDHGLQVRIIMASKRISKLGWSWSASASPKSLDYGLQVHRWVHLITASQCITKLARS